MSPPVTLFFFSVSLRLVLIDLLTKPKMLNKFSRKLYKHRTEVKQI